MSLAEKIHQTKRIIKKRLAIAKIFGNEGLIESPHRMHKWNLNCGCKLCHYYKHCGNKKAKYKHRDIKMYEQSNQTPDN